MIEIEPAAHIRLTKFSRRDLRDHSFAESRSPQRRIVNNYGHAVTGQTNVQLDTGGPVLKGSLERGQRIFRSQLRSAAVADYQWRSFRDCLGQGAVCHRGVDYFLCGLAPLRETCPSKERLKSLAQRRPAETRCRQRYSRARPFSSPLVTRFSLM